MQALRRIISQPALRQATYSSQRLLQTTSSLNMPIKVGDSLPKVDLFNGAPDAKVNTGSFTGKTVIFGVPGAYTPTCSAEHAPGFVQNVDALKAKGVSNVVCVSVNDPFVMGAWGKVIDPAGKIQFLADTGAAFTKAIDLEFDLSAVLGNVRSKRYVLVVDNGVVTNLNVEPDGAGLTCSRAADVLKML